MTGQLKERYSAKRASPIPPIEYLSKIFRKGFSSFVYKNIQNIKKQKKRKERNKIVNAQTKRELQTL